MAKPAEDLAKSTLDDTSGLHLVSPKLEDKLADDSFYEQPGDTFALNVMKSDKGYVVQEGLVRENRFILQMTYDCILDRKPARQRIGKDQIQHSGIHQG